MPDRSTYVVPVGLTMATLPKLRWNRALAFLSVHIVSAPHVGKTVEVSCGEAPRASKCYVRPLLGTASAVHEVENFAAHVFDPTRGRLLFLSLHDSG